MTENRTAVLSSSYHSRDALSGMMRRIEGMIERHQKGELIPAKFKNVTEERKPNAKIGSWQLAALYHKAKKENRTLGKVAKEAGIGPSNLYIWARKNGLPPTGNGKRTLKRAK